MTPTKRIYTIKATNIQNNTSNESGTLSSRLRNWISRKTRVTCFYCNQQSILPRSETDRDTKDNWHCYHCECDNILDKNGDIVDYVPEMSASPEESTKRNQQRQQHCSIVNGYHSDTGGLGGALPGYISGDDKISLCNTCLRNQRIVRQLLDQYIPNENSPGYELAITKVGEYQKEVEKRYPTVCKKCENAVKKRLDTQTHWIRTKAFQSALKRSSRDVFVPQSSSWKPSTISTGLLSRFLSKQKSSLSNSSKPPTVRRNNIGQDVPNNGGILNEINGDVGLDGKRIEQRPTLRNKKMLMFWSLTFVLGFVGCNIILPLTIYLERPIHKHISTKYIDLSSFTRVSVLTKMNFTPLVTLGLMNFNPFWLKIAKNPTWKLVNKNAYQKSIAKLAIYRFLAVGILLLNEKLEGLELIQDYYYYYWGSHNNKTKFEISLLVVDYSLLVWAINRLKIKYPKQIAKQYHSIVDGVEGGDLSIDNENGGDDGAVYKREPLAYDASVDDANDSFFNLSLGKLLKSHKPRPPSNSGITGIGSDESDNENRFSNDDGNSSDEELTQLIPKNRNYPSGVNSNSDGTTVHGDSRIFNLRNRQPYAQSWASHILRSNKGKSHSDSFFGYSKGTSGDDGDEDEDDDMIVDLMQSLGGGKNNSSIRPRTKERASVRNIKWNRQNSTISKTSSGGKNDSKSKSALFRPQQFPIPTKPADGLEDIVSKSLKISGDDFDGSSAGGSGISSSFISKLRATSNCKRMFKRIRESVGVRHAFGVVVFVQYVITWIYSKHWWIHDLYVALITVYVFWVGSLIIWTPTSLSSIHHAAVQSRKSSNDEGLAVGKNIVANPNDMCIDTPDPIYNTTNNSSSSSKRKSLMKPVKFDNREKYYSQIPIRSRRTSSRSSWKLLALLTIILGMLCARMLGPQSLNNVLDVNIVHQMVSDNESESNEVKNSSILPDIDIGENDDDERYSPNWVDWKLATHSCIKELLIGAPSPPKPRSKQRKSPWKLDVNRCPWAIFKKERPNNKYGNGSSDDWNGTEERTEGWPFIFWLDLGIEVLSTSLILADILMLF
ncbi:hypothetical protein H4219_006115 [Mycoemilia scoparia]|uniref:Ima1 N-terminal domain-containing protein n=1 Tax=Mycoemilia scoparia TaxID=417184 RepID=A0A9W7ZJS0_9FUNG|nr:hypothetical protein H4219_006115 [Mycoemilia scoparia]